MKIAIKQGAGHLWTFSQPLDDDTVEYVKEAIQDENVDPDESYLMSWDAEKQEIVAVYGRIPASYDDFMYSTDYEDRERKVVRIKRIFAKETKSKQCNE